MKKEMFKKLTALAICSIMLVLPTLSFAADGFITPWNSTYNFDSTTFESHTNPAGSNSQSPSNSTYPYMATYSYLYLLYEGCTAEVRDSYTDTVSNTVVYDNITKTQGNKYLYLKNGRTLDGGGISGTFFHNIATNLAKSPYTLNVANMNGGICHGKVTYTADIRLNNITKADSNKGLIKIFAYVDDKRADLIQLNLNTNASGSYYISAYNHIDKAYRSLGEGVGKDKWCRVKITYEVGKNNVKYELYHYDDNGKPALKGMKEWELKDSNLVNAPVMPTIQITGPANCDTSIDNVSVTKEMFAIDEESKNISVEGDTVTATVKIANDVYADKSFGSEITTTSPKVILATYGEGNGLINANFASVEFTDHELPSNATNAQKKEFFTKALDYKDVTVTVPKTSDMLNAKVFVWNNMTDMFPYISAE